MTTGESASVPDDRGVQETGSYGVPSRGRVIVYSFGRFRITVRVTDLQEFMGIEAVEVVDTDLLSYRQKAALAQSDDVWEFYDDK